MSEQPIIIFLHLPKTAGITFTDILRRQYGDKLWHPHHATVDELESITPEQKKALLACRGQMFYGLHELFLPRPSQYIVFLRNPVERMVSWYYYILGRPTNWFHETLTSKNMSLLDFIHFIGDNNYDNQQTRWIAGYKPTGEYRTLKQIATPIITDFPLEPIQDEWLDTAKQHLETHFSVGITERFDESLLLMKRQFGWKDVYYYSKNVTKDRPMRDKKFPEEVVHLIQKQEYLDIQLYDFAKTRFEAQVTALGDKFQHEVAAFYRGNKMYNLARNIYHRVPPGIGSIAKKSLGRTFFGRAIEE